MIEDNQPYTVYTFSIEEFTRNNNVMVSRKFIVRRFREFSNLHKSLEIRFAHDKHKLP